MFARELRTAEDASTGASRGLVADAWPPRLAFFAYPPRAGRQVRDVKWIHYESHDLTLTQDLLRPPLPRRVDERLDVALRRRLQYPMTQIQDVHARPAGALDAFLHCFFHFVDRTQ